MAARFDERGLEVEQFPADKDALELTWAQRFAAALEKQKGMRYVVSGRAPEPLDIFACAAG
jgi:hypothetical protein